MLSLLHCATEKDIPFILILSQFPGYYDQLAGVGTGYMDSLDILIAFSCRSSIAITRASCISTPSQFVQFVPILRTLMKGNSAYNFLTLSPAQGSPYCFTMVA